MFKWLKENKLILILQIVLIAYLIVFSIISAYFDKTFLRGNIFGKEVNIGWVLLIMCILEFISTFTFQLRMKLTADFEINQKKKLIWIVPLIAGFSWCVAGIQGIVLIGDSDDLYKTIIKLFPVFIATFNGVYLIMKGKIKK